MATPRVTLKSKTSARGSRTFYLDYRVNGKRMRPNVGSNKKDAELVRAKVEQEIVLGTYQLNSTRKSVSLSGLIDEFLRTKENTVRATTQHRYRNYLDPLRAYFNKSFPTVTGDIRLIETKYFRKFIDDSIRGDAGTGRAWSRRTAKPTQNEQLRPDNYDYDLVRLEAPSRRILADMLAANLVCKGPQKPGI